VFAGGNTAPPQENHRRQGAPKQDIAAIYLLCLLV